MNPRYTSMIKFDLPEFLRDRKISLVEFGKTVGMNYQSAILLKNRKTIKISFYRELEKIYLNDLSKYTNKKTKKQTLKTAA